MPKYNKKTQGTKTKNRAGGVGYAVEDKFKLLSILLSSFMEDQYYRSADETQGELTDLVSRIDPSFSAKAALFARDKWNMRSTSHVIAGELAGQNLQFSGRRQFFTDVVVRLDDMSEICAYVTNNYPNKRANGRHRLPSVLKHGFKAAFDKFDDYKIAKYKMAGRDWSLIDLVNLIRPVPTPNNRLSLQRLVKDTLVSKDTWEHDVSASGQGGDDFDKDRAKAEAWGKLVEEGKLAHMALLRNLRNIAKYCSEDTLKLALTQLKDPAIIENSRVLPFRYVTAHKKISEDKELPGLRKILSALSKAMDISCKNVPQAFENTVVVVDVSGSMNCLISEKSILNIKEAASAFAAILAKSNDADLMIFASDAEYVDYNPDDSVLTIANKISSYEGCNGHGTSISSAFARLNKKYDRVILLGDTQTWQDGMWRDGRNVWVGQTQRDPNKTFQAYKSEYDADPIVFSIDLAGYGTVNLPKAGAKIIPLAGWSAQMFDIMEICEGDPEALIHAVEGYSQEV